MTGKRKQILFDLLTACQVIALVHWKWPKIWPVPWLKNNSKVKGGVAVVPGPDLLEFLNVIR